jgi:Fur family ferric uptake transcriptional regulator
VIVGRETHDYLICVTTGRVVELSSERLKQLRDDICREHGYEPLSHQFHIFAVSPEGQKETAAGSAALNPGRK